MPSHFIHGALFLMQPYDNAPWCFPSWQQLTGVKEGLFPKDDSLLPLGWARKDSQNVERFYEEFSLKRKEEEKIKFSSMRKDDNIFPGRPFFRKWITQNWKAWNVHGRVVQILFANDLHPVTIALAGRDRSLDNWPDARTYIPLAIDAVAIDLFGPECLDCLDRLMAELRSPVQALIYRTWCNSRNKVDRAKKNIQKLEQDALEAFADLDRDHPSKAKIKAVIVKVGRWKAAAETLASAELIEKIQQMDTELENLMANLTGKATKTLSKPKLVKLTAQMLQSLASEEDVQDVINLYNDLFSKESNEDDDEPDQHQGPSLLSFPDDEIDLGMELEIKMEPQALEDALGLVDGLPFLFNRYRHIGGVTSWDVEADTPYARPSTELLETKFSPLTLLWSQTSGLHALVRMILSDAPINQPFAGALPADDVGLGKTILSIALIAIFIDSIIRRKMEQPQAPLFAQRPFLGQQKGLPDLPFLVIIPGTLQEQWIREMKICFRTKAVDILPYPTGRSQREIFWSKEGPFHTSKHPPSQRIIVAPLSAIEQDYRLTRAKGSKFDPRRPLDIPGQIGSESPLLRQTLFGYMFLKMILDEAHNVRNAGVRQQAILALFQNARIRLPLTATPLQTATKDLAAMGRIVGIPHFLSQESLIQERADTTMLVKLKKAVSDEDSATNLSDYKEKQEEIARRIQAQFGGKVLRRTIHSKDCFGNQLITIPPYKKMTLHLDLRDWEMSIIADLGRQVRESSECTNAIARVQSKKFYIEYRLGVGWPRPNLTDPFPTFRNLEDWQARPSTKFDTAVRIIQHYLTRDDLPDVYAENGQVVIPVVDPLPPNVAPANTTKIVVYQQFPSLTPLLKNVLELYRISSVNISGDMPYDKRGAVISVFRNDPDARVLILSSVGSVGLNLAFANVILFLDQPWSAQDEKQIRGRVHRQPQSKEVKSIHLLANNTADVLVADLAEGKKTALNAFLVKYQEDGQALLDGLQGKVSANEEDDLDEEELVAKKKEEKKEAKKKSKGKSKTETEEGLETAEKNKMKTKPTTAKASTSGHRYKSVATISSDEEIAPPPPNQMALQRDPVSDAPLLSKLIPNQTVADSSSVVTGSAPELTDPDALSLAPVSLSEAESEVFTAESRISHPHTPGLRRRRSEFAQPDEDSPEMKKEMKRSRLHRKPSTSSNDNHAYAGDTDADADMDVDVEQGSDDEFFNPPNACSRSWNLLLTWSKGQAHQASREPFTPSCALATASQPAVTPSEPHSQVPSVSARPPAQTQPAARTTSSTSSEGVRQALASSSKQLEGSSSAARRRADILIPHLPSDSPLVRTAAWKRSLHQQNKANKSRGTMSRNSSPPPAVTASQNPFNKNPAKKT